MYKTLLATVAMTFLTTGVLSAALPTVADQLSRRVLDAACGIHLRYDGNLFIQEVRVSQPQTLGSQVIIDQKTGNLTGAGVTFSIPALGARTAAQNLVIQGSSLGDGNGDQVNFWFGADMWDQGRCSVGSWDDNGSLFESGLQYEDQSMDCTFSCT